MARRVNGGHLAGLVGAKVTLVGKVAQNHGGQSVVVESSDKKPVTVHVSHPVPPEIKVIEFVGAVQQDGSVVEEGRSLLSDNFDMDAYNEVVLLANGAFAKAFY